MTRTGTMAAGDGGARGGGPAPPPLPPVPPVQGARPVRGGSGRIWFRGALALGVLAAGYVLWRHEPRGQAFYPACLWYATTGWQCPGCGGLRATHALLNGDLAVAWRMNPLLVLSLPLAGWAAASRWVRVGGRRLPDPLVHPWVLGGVAGVVAGYGIARNLPLGTWLGF